MANESKLRMPQLDALRGLAALSVFWFHAFQMIATKPPVLAFILASPLAIFFNGRAAVLLFFVLSGFVLNIKYVNTEEYPQFWKSDFIIRRVFRIYPAFLLAILVAYILKTTVFNPTQAYAIYPDGFAHEWKVPFHLSELPALLSLVFPGLRLDLDPPVWSLVEEMRISLMFPLLVVAVNRWPRKLANAGVLSTAYAVGLAHPQMSTIRYLPHFVLGAICAQHFTEISGWLRRRGMLMRAAWLVLALGLYGATTLVPNEPSLGLRTKFLIEQLVGWGAAGTIIFVGTLASPKGIMGSKPFRFIGATSYSFYLLHSVFLYGLSYLVMKSTGSLALACVVVLAITYLSAALLFQFVEMPLNQVGHHVVRRLFPRELQRLPGQAALVPQPVETVSAVERQD